MVSPDFLQRFQQRALTDKPANSVGDSADYLNQAEINPTAQVDCPPDKRNVRKTPGNFQQEGPGSLHRAR